MASGFVFLVYSTLVSFIAVARAGAYGCYKVFGGLSCTENESSVQICLLIGIAHEHFYDVNFYYSFWPIVAGHEKISLGFFSIQ